MNVLECLELGINFMDVNTGYVYHISDYVHNKKLGLPNPYGEDNIFVSKDGKPIGVWHRRGGMCIFK